jgi:hypothetical protein
MTVNWILLQPGQRRGSRRKQPLDHNSLLAAQAPLQPGVRPGGRGGRDGQAVLQRSGGRFRRETPNLSPGAVSAEVEMDTTGVMRTTDSDGVWGDESRGRRGARAETASAPRSIAALTPSSPYSLLLALGQYIGEWRGLILAGVVGTRGREAGCRS